MMCTGQQQQLVHAANPDPDTGTGHNYVTTKTPGHLRLSSQFPIATNCRYMRLPDHNIARWSEDVSLGSTRLSPLLHTHFPEGHMERRAAPAATSHHIPQTRGRPTLSVVKFCFSSCVLDFDS